MEAGCNVLNVEGPLPSLEMHQLKIILEANALSMWVVETRPERTLKGQIIYSVQSSLSKMVCIIKMHNIKRV